MYIFIVDVKFNSTDIETRSMHLTIAFYLMGLRTVNWYETSLGMDLVLSADMV